MDLVLRLGMNLFVIVIAFSAVASASSSLPLSGKAFSISPVEAQVLSPEPGPLLNGPLLQSPISSPVHDSPPPLAAEPPHGSYVPVVTKPPVAVSPMPIVEPQRPPHSPAETPHVSTAPPNAQAEPSHDSTPPASAMPLPPRGSNLPLAAKPPEAASPMPIVNPLQPPSLMAEAPYKQPHVSAPPPHESTPAPAAEPPHELTLPLVGKPPEAVSPMPIVEPPKLLTLLPPPQKQPILPSSPPVEVPQVPVMPNPPPILKNVSAPKPQVVPKHASAPGSIVPPHDLALPPVNLPLPLNPHLPLPSLSPAEMPHESSPISLPLPLPLPLPPPSARPPSSSPPPASIELPFVSPPPASVIPKATPPYASSPPPLIMSPLAPLPLVIPDPHALYGPPPSEPSHSSVPPSPAVQGAIPAVTPRVPPSKEPHSRAPPLMPESPESSPSSISPIGAPPVKQASPETRPPISQQIEAPTHSAPFTKRSNVSEAHASPLAAPAPPATPPSTTSVQLSPAPKPSPHHAYHLYKPPSEPKVERQNKTAPTPLSLQAPPPSGGPHFSSHHSPVKGSPVAEVPSPSTSEIPEISHASLPISRRPSGHTGIALLSPKFLPSAPSISSSKRPIAPPILSLPPPPPNEDCGYLTCPEPFTNTPPGSPCDCVWPMQVGLRLSMPLYTFFPLVSELAKEITAGVLMKQGQVRVMGAKSASQDLEKTIILVDLVPLHEKFDGATASLISQKFWHKQVKIDNSIFGDYDVLYVNYPGLPPSPPMAPADMAVINSMPYSVADSNGSRLHPLGVELPERRHKDRLNGNVIAVIVFSAMVGVLLCFSVAWFLIFRHKDHNSNPALPLRAQHSLGRSSGPTGHSTGSGPGSPLSLGSSLGKYGGSAKTFSAGEIEKATDYFNPSTLVGEGGFGCVYSGTLEDGTNIAVKVLKRDDQQGGREFLAEVEMLSRLHHRNLVKLNGICINDSMRCLVYELVPNGSVESHLHGTDKETSPLDWPSRLKIALGAARGLAYLHEDSSPGVIHRDFKSSNILLENDFTPKVSDFGLARSTMDEENKHISTHIKGTFGYVAPEYAMTGHLLVKSDVYSYGVVLLELLTGRQPVDMSQPSGPENLVAWARPLLTRREGLELIIDPILQSSDISWDSIAKVAAIASMCIQPEVSHRPFMGEVVQALKLVCNGCDESKETINDSRNCSPKNMSVDFDAHWTALLDETPDPLQSQLSLREYLSGCDVEKGFPRHEVFSMSTGFSRQRWSPSPLRRQCTSGPMRSVKGLPFWQSIRNLSHGSLSERGIMSRFWAG